MTELVLIYVKYTASHVVVLAQIGSSGELVHTSTEGDFGGRVSKTKRIDVIKGPYVAVSMDYDGDVTVDMLRALPTRQEFDGICLLITSDQGRLAKRNNINVEEVYASFVQRVLQGSAWSFAAQITSVEDTDES